MTCNCNDCACDHQMALRKERIEEEAIMSTDKIRKLAEDMDAEKLARQFHRTYERLAPEYGYETRLDTRDFDPETDNGRLMIAVCEAILQAIGGEG